MPSAWCFEAWTGSTHHIAQWEKPPLAAHFSYQSMTPCPLSPFTYLISSFFPGSIGTHFTGTRVAEVPAVTWGGGP